jgi:hypothetical protein
MHAVVVRVNIKDVEAAEAMLREEVVPRVSQAPGFKTGYWTRSGDGGNGMSLIVFESEDVAQAAAQALQQQGLGSDAVSLEGIEVREVVAQA